ncbi:MAG: hypothetical protein ACP5I4_08530 [Oceanipulchritudo sp.]
MKLTYLTPMLSLSLLAIPAAHADWTLIENFEDGEFPEGTVITNSVDLFDGEHRITTDPLDPDNQVDRIVADVSSGIRNQGNFLDFSFPLETPIADGSVATFYHRIMVEGPEDENDADGPFGFFDTSYGFVDVEFDGSWAYGDFEAQLGYSLLTNLWWTIRNADETGQYAPWTPIWQNVDPLNDLNVWYEIWVVIDHGTDTSDVYIKGGQFTEQTLAVENARFRNGGSTSPLKYFVMKSHNGNEDTDAGYRGIDPWYLDDLYIDYTGENLTTPEGGNTGLVLTPGEYSYDSLLSWTLGLTADIGQSQMLDYVYIGQHPVAIYSYDLGWLLNPVGTAAGGIFLYRYDTANWIWTVESYGGFYWDYASSTWGSVF